MPDIASRRNRSEVLASVNVRRADLRSSRSFQADDENTQIVQDSYGRVLRDATFGRRPRLEGGGRAFVGNGKKENLRKCWMQSMLQVHVVNHVHASHAAYHAHVNRTNEIQFGFDCMLLQT